MEKFKPWLIVLAVVVAIGLGAHWLSKTVGSQLGASNVKFSLWNVFAIGMMAAAFIWGLKGITAKFPIPGLTNVAQAL